MPMQVRFLNQQRLQVRAVALPGNVIDVFGRTGHVVSANGDYTASQITNVPSGLVTATTVQGAINQLSTGGGVTPAALTKTDDSNITLTLGGTPNTALLQATSITVGWTGTLTVGRGGIGTSTLTSNGVLLGNSASAIAPLSPGNTGTILTSPGGGAAPTWQSGFPLQDVDDTNVTLAWSGSSLTAVLGTTTLTAGWTGTLAVARGGIGTGSWAGTNSIVASGINATGTIQIVANAATGTVLTSNGVGALPTFQAAGAVAVAPTAPQGRLSLVSLTPVMTATVASGTTLFYTPYCGDRVPIFDGSNYSMTSIGSEISVLTNDTTKSPGSLTISSVYDWFVWNDAGTVRIGHGPPWTNDTTRAAGTALQRVAGIYLNSATITNGPAAQRGTYVGTTRSNSSATLQWSYGGVAAGGTASFFGVWNMYNRVSVASMAGDNTDTWTYSTATWRSANASTNMRASFVCGLAEDEVAATYDILATHTGGNAVVGIGIDSTSAFTGFTGLANATTLGGSCVAMYRGIPGIGFHFVQAIEYATTATATYYGDIGVAYFQSGLAFEARM